MYIQEYGTYVTVNNNSNNSNNSSDSNNNNNVNITSRYDCSICCDDKVNPVVLICNHSFCEVCILKWLEREKTCPVCRTEIKSNFKYMQLYKSDIDATFPIIT